MRSWNQACGELLFSYRSGSSGNGDTCLNQFNEGVGSWTPFHGSLTTPVPLFKGI
jgi:hypothetical protein